MAVSTLKNLVQQSVSVVGVKLMTPADSIGQGNTARYTYPADLLSPGQLPLPESPESEMASGMMWETSEPRLLQQPRLQASITSRATGDGCRQPGISHPEDSLSNPIRKGWDLAAKCFAGLDVR